MKNTSIVSAGRDRKDGDRPCVCRSCSTPLDRVVVELGMSPPCEAIVHEHQLDDMEPHYPMRVMVCHRCFLMQIRNYVDPTQIFREYAYFSSFSTSWVAHAKTYCEMMQKRFALGSASRVVEIGSNDGYLLQHFVPMGVSVLGIEPATNVAASAERRGVHTLNEFFTLAFARKLVADGLHADLIIANNVLAQVDELNDFLAALKELLTPEGVITIEVPTAECLLRDSQFDTIYHEHYSYFTLTSLKFAASQHALRIFDVEDLDTHGGSLRFFICHTGSGHPPEPRVAAVACREDEFGISDLNTYSFFSEQVRRIKRDLLTVLIEAKASGKQICGYGAPGKGNTLLNYCGIGTDFLDFTVDRNPYKHGQFTPGMHIPILDVPALYAARPDYVLILPWNLEDEIITQIRRDGGWDPKFIVPIPIVAVK